MKPCNTLIKTAAILILCCGILSGCQKYNQDITWQVNTSIYSSPVLLRFLNADPQATTEPKNFKVTISGRDADKVVVESGGVDFKAVNGLLPLALEQGVTPTPDNPVIFNVYADIPGFAPISQSIILTDTTPAVRSIFAVNYAAPVKGTATLSRQTALTAGISGTTVLSTATNADMDEKTTITIQDGTQMLDANGNAISASSLQTKAIHFGTGTSASLAAFPGGLTAPDAIGKDGNPIAGGVTFITGGLLSLRMQAGGTEVKKFSKPLQVSMEMNSNVVNPGTNQAVASGDSIPVWSLNEQTGQWKYESMGVVKPDANGKLAVNFEAAHLSCWNLDWWWSQFGSYQTCNVPLKVIVHADPSYCAGNFEITLETKNNCYLGALHGTPLYNGFECTFANLPVIEQAKIVITNNANGKIVAETPLFKPCTQGTIEVTLGVPPLPDVVNVNLNVGGKCINRTAGFNINGWFYFYLAATGPLADKVLVYVKDGKCSLKLLNGATYTIEACYDFRDYTAVGVFEKNNFTFNPVADAKYTLTGTGTFNSVTNTLDVDFIVETNCGN